MASLKTKPIFIVSLIVDDTVAETCYSYHALNRTIGATVKRYNRAPNIEVTIRYKGRVIAELTTNHNGVFNSLEIHARGRSIVSNMNPYWSGFGLGGLI